jgi:hypothetical protein
VLSKRCCESANLDKDFLNARDDRTEKSTAKEHTTEEVHLSKRPYDYEPIPAVTTITRSACAGTAAAPATATAVGCIAATACCAGGMTAPARATCEQQRHSF